MTEDELIDQKEQMQASLEELYAKRTAAELQIACHQGHVERINIWLRRIDYAKSNNQPG